MNFKKKKKKIFLYNKHHIKYIVKFINKKTL